MSDYDPDPGAIPVPPYSTDYFSQRDLGIAVPINFVTQAGVSFSAACFSHLIFEEESFKTCFSNLLTNGYRRFLIDVYWDQGRSSWNLCPVSIATNQPNASSTPTAPTAPVISTAVLSDAIVTGTPVAIAKRLVSGSPVRASATVTSSEVKTSPSSALPSISYDSPEPELSMPPYMCTATLDLLTAISLLTEYIQQTENTLAAHLIYVILNIHAAASAASPALPAPSPTILPSSSDLLGSFFSANLSAYLYTPSNLLSERTNLNNSWYTVPERYRPAAGYYTTNSNEYGIVSTEDGWPTENYVEFSKSKRLLVGYGTVDSQMKRYNFTGDEEYIFPAGFIQANQTVVGSTESDNITSGCFLVPDLANISLTDINSSWATASSALNIDYSSANTNITTILNISSSLTSCGISPILNHTLLNSTAQENYTPYQNFSHSTIWSWAPGEPKNFTDGDSGSDALFRCARTTLNARKWRSDDCSTKSYAACRIPNEPYNWTLTTYQVSYSFAAAACPAPYIFFVPQTALENSYLHQSLLQIAPHRDFDGDDAVWIDFNSIDTKGCWVTGGINATCPYTDNQGLREEVQRKAVLVPTVAAIIILVVTLLTVFVKVGGNRSTVRSKRRKRGGVFYEGVPS